MWPRSKRRTPRDFTYQPSQLRPDQRELYENKALPTASRWFTVRPPNGPRPCELCCQNCLATRCFVTTTVRGSSGQHGRRAHRAGDECRTRSHRWLTLHQQYHDPKIGRQSVPLAGINAEDTVGGAPLCYSGHKQNSAHDERDSCDHWTDSEKAYKRDRCHNEK